MNMSLNTAVDDKVGVDNWYHELCRLNEVQPVTQVRVVEVNSIDENPAAFNERLTAALQVLLEMVSSEDAPLLNKMDRAYLDQLIVQVDQRLSDQLDAILHQPEFKALESTWLSLQHLVDRVDFRSNVLLHMLDVDKETLSDDFDDALDIRESGLYKHIYDQAYDMPGGKPVSAMISGFDFTPQLPDVQLLNHIGQVSASAHCPFIASASAQFFGKDSMESVTQISHLMEHFERPEYLHWNHFRASDNARYIGLTLPNFLLRLPYGQQHPTKGFFYHEQVVGADHQKYTWGSASYAFAANLAQAFQKHGWLVNIRGPESGGRVDGLVLHQYDIGQGVELKIPTEVMISETRELALSDLGFIPMCYYKDSPYACFFSANSCHLPAKYDTKEATANSKINARLPYIFLSSRLGHYLKVLQRESIGGAKSRVTLETELNQWLGNLVTQMPNPGPSLLAERPLKEGRVTVLENPEDPGFFKVNLHIVPHFQIEGIDVKLSLVSQMPNQKSTV